MDIRDLVKRLEDIETEARDKREYGLEDSIGRLIEDIIEDDLEQERLFRKEPDCDRKSNKEPGEKEGSHDMEPVF